MEKILNQTHFDFIKILETLSIPYAIMGGVAYGYWVEERFTKDLDLAILLEKQKWQALKIYLEKMPDLKLDRVLQEEGFHVPYLIRLSYYNQAIDLLIGLTEFEKSMLSRRLEVDWYGQKVQIASPEDIIVSKLIADRSQDRLDVGKFLLHLTGLDFSYIEKWVHVWQLEEKWKDALESLSKK